MFLNRFGEQKSIGENINKLNCFYATIVKIKEQLGPISLINQNQRK